MHVVLSQVRTAESHVVTTSADDTGSVASTNGAAEQSGSVGSYAR
jgi:hypothetical protein